MKKFIICVICLILLLSTVCIIPASAYTLPADMTLFGKNILLKNLETNMVVYEKNIDEQIFPASITKLMTALVVMDKVKDINEIATCGENVEKDLLGTDASIMFLKPGEQIPVKELLYGLLVSSGCDAANVLAEHVSGSVFAFVEEMNNMAKKLGMENTNYMNAHGLHDDNHYTTVRDLEKLGTAVIQNETLVEICGTSRYTVPPTNKSDERYLSTTNQMLDASTSNYYKRIRGLKTGFTDAAGRCLMSYAVNEDKGQSYLCIVMGCAPEDENGKYVRNEFKDTYNLLYWAYTDFDYVTVAKKDSPTAEVNVRLCKERDFVLAVTESDLSAIIPKDSLSSVIVEPHIGSTEIEAPVNKGDYLGYAVVYCAGVELGRVDLVASESCERSFTLLVTDSVKKALFHPVTIIVFGILFLALAVFAFFNIRENIIRARLYDEKMKQKEIDNNGRW